MINISIIIPHFNSSESLKKLLASIPNIPCIEVIVIDDHSTQPVELPRTLHSNFKLVSNKYAKGAGGARNTGIEIARGDWLLFADSDDYFIEGGINRVVSAINNTDDEDILFFPPTSSYLDTNKAAKRHLKYSDLVYSYIRDDSYKNKIMLLFSHYVPWSKAINIELIKSNGIYFDETLIANDGMFSAKCSLKSKKIKCFSEPIYNVTVSQGSLTKIKNVELFRIRLEVFSRMFHYLPNEYKNIIGMSPLALIYMSRAYGRKELFRTINFFANNNVSFFKYFNFSSIKRFFKK